MNSAVFYFFQRIVREHQVTIKTGQESKFDELLQDAMNREMMDLIDSYQEGYEAAFNHEQSKAKEFCERKRIIGNEKIK